MNGISTVVVVRRESPCTLDARMLLDEASVCVALYSGEIGQRRFDVEDFCTPRGAFVVARTMDGHAIGCGALRRFSFEAAEFKRIYRRPDWPGAGEAILEFLEVVAAGMGYRQVLVQASAANRRAIGYYLRHGYAPTPTFGEYPAVADARCFAKPLPLAQSL